MSSVYFYCTFFLFLFWKVCCTVACQVLMYCGICVLCSPYAEECVMLFCLELYHIGCLAFLFWAVLSIYMYFFLYALSLSTLVFCYHGTLSGSAVFLNPSPLCHSTPHCLLPVFSSRDDVLLHTIIAPSSTVSVQWFPSLSNCVISHPCFHHFSSFFHHTPLTIFWTSFSLSMHHDTVCPSSDRDPRGPVP